MKTLLLLALAVLPLGLLAARQMRGAPAPLPIKPTPTRAPQSDDCDSILSLQWSSDARFVMGYTIRDPLDDCPQITRYFRADGTPVNLTESQNARLFGLPYQLNAADEPVVGLRDQRDGSVCELQGTRGVVESGFDVGVGCLTWQMQGELFSPDAREFYAVYRGVFHAWRCADGRLLRRARLFAPVDGIGDWVTLSANGERALWERRDSRHGYHQATTRLLDTGTGGTVFVVGDKVPDADDLSAGFAADGLVIWTWREQGESSRRRVRLQVRDANGRALWSRQFPATTRKVPGLEGVTIAGSSVQAVGARLLLWQGRDVELCDARRGNTLVRLKLDEMPLRSALAPDASQLWGTLANAEVRRWKLLDAARKPAQ